MASGKDRILSQGPQRKVLTEEQTTRSVVVTRISHQTSDSAIVIYFQQAKNGGGELDHVHIPQKGKAVITFANIQDPGQVNEMSRGDQTKRPNCLLCDNFNAPLFPSPCRRDHYFCTSCYQALSARTEFCSQCKKEGLFQGNQQTGEMTWIADTEISLPGYDDCGVIMVQFSFDKGIQGPGSPNPGQPYNASTTTCYLPFNREGEEVCFLLKKAFEANLLFTIEEDKIVCNGIELITDRFKGNVNYENTDPGYLARIRGQLAKLGITVQQL